MSKDLRLMNLTVDYFCCPLCREVVVDPIECLGCERLFCCRCLEECFSSMDEPGCPSGCMDPVFEKPGHAFQRLLTCIYSPCRTADCNHVESISSIMAHESKCKPKPAQLEIEVDEALQQRDYFWIQILNKVLSPNNQSPFFSASVGKKLNSCTAKAQRCFNF
jgi:hypothetical protein